MTSAESETLVIRSEAGEYYTVPWDVIDRHRVSAGQTDAFEAALGDDVAGFSLDGIGRLIAVTRMKAANANDEALAGADKQRDLIGQQRQLRAANQYYAALVTGLRWPP